MDFYKGLTVLSFVLVAWLLWDKLTAQKAVIGLPSEGANASLSTEDQVKALLASE